MSVAVLVSTAAFPRTSHGQDDGMRCPTAGRAIGDGTLPVGVASADFGAIPEACIGSDAAIRMRGSLTVAAESPDFYGSLAAAAGLRLRHALGARWMFWLAADVATYRFVQNAAVSSAGVGIGPPVLGVGRALVASSRLALTAFSRLLLPFDSARRQGSLFAAEWGASATATGPRPGLGLQGGLSLGVPVIVVGGQTHAEIRTSALVEAWASGPRLAGTMGGFARVQLAPQQGRPSSFGVRAGGRLALQRGFWLAAVTEVPLVGGDRTDVILALWTGLTPAAGRR